MKRLTQHFIVVAALLASIITLFQISNAHANEEYIGTLDLTVVERNEGVAIMKIGRHSPFRRYSWFRVGDIIEEVNGLKASTYILYTLVNETPKIKYRRGSELTVLRQISLEISIYGKPPYINKENKP